MKPLNPQDVIWLTRTPDEIDKFLRSPEVRDHTIVLGYAEDAKRTLMTAAQPGPVYESNFKPLLAREGLEIAFLLMQGKVVGLIKRPVKGVTGE
jgi:hypothetical protein